MFKLNQTQLSVISGGNGGISSGEFLLGASGAIGLYLGTSRGVSNLGDVESIADLGANLYNLGSTVIGCTMGCVLLSTLAVAYHEASMAQYEQPNHVYIKRHRS